MTLPAHDPRIFIDQSRFPRIETFQIDKEASFLRRGPKSSASAETELLYGTLFHVHRKGRGWVWGQAQCPLPGQQFPGYVGWVPSRDLGPSVEKPSHKITALSAPVFARADIKTQVLCHLSLSCVFNGQDKDDFLRMPMGFIHKNHVLPLSARPDYLDWVAVAESLLGRPYVWGGVSSVGLDCSGLVQTSLRFMGSDIPRDTDQQAEVGQPVSIKDDLSGLKRGDLIFWKGHVGIMTSRTDLLHANAHHMAVSIEPLIDAVQRIGDITTIRRLAE